MRKSLAGHFNYNTNFTIITSTNFTYSSDITLEDYRNYTCAARRSFEKFIIVKVAFVILYIVTLLVIKIVRCLGRFVVAIVVKITISVVVVIIVVIIIITSFDIIEKPFSMQDFNSITTTFAEEQVGDIDSP